MLFSRDSGEWLTGPWLALRLNLTYVCTDMLKQSSRWNAFLGLSEGEDTVEDLVVRYGGVSRVETRSQMDPTQNFDTLPMLNWTAHAIDWVRRDPLLAQARAQVAQDRLWASQRSNALTPGLPFPVLIEAHMVAVPRHSVVCEPLIQRTIRQKYCAARIRNPVPYDFYAADRAQGKIIITWHLRCGDECFSAFRSTSFDSIVKTCWALKALFARIEPQRSIVLYFFSQKPHNDTAEHHFQPLLDRLQPMETRTNWHAKSTTVLHHLITSGQPASARKRNQCGVETEHSDRACSWLSRLTILRSLMFCLFDSLCV